MILSFTDFHVKTPFYVFGSEDSTDYDVIVSVNTIPPVEQAHFICKAWDKELAKLLTDKPLNCNLGVFRDGTLIDVFKGTKDELINVIYYTYDNHKQYFPNPIKSPIERDIDTKIIRVARFIISFFSRTHLRNDIKAALRGDLYLRLSVLKNIDFTIMTEFPGKKDANVDIYKILAFQFGQVFSLIDGHEPDSYTKNSVIKNYPDLSNLLRRGVTRNADFVILNDYMARFIDLIEERIEDMDKINE